MTANYDLTDQEKEAIEELKTRISEDLPSKVNEDGTLFYRFLKARNFNVDDAEKMLRKHLEWRQEKNVDTVLTDYKKSELIKKHLPNNQIGFDKDGSPVRYVPIGNADIKGLYMSIRFLELERSIVQDNEIDMSLTMQQTRKLGKPVTQCVYIYNMENMTFAKATDKKAVNLLIYTINNYQDNYPERLKAAYVINASMYFTLLFPLLKKFLANTVLDKIHIFGTDDWKEELLKVFNPDDLPAFLGGNKTDPDGNPLCQTFINHGGPVPHSFYINKSSRSLAKVPGVQKIVLSRASFFEATVEVKEPNSLLEWEFETKCRDIGFGLFYQEIVDGEEKITELIPIQRIDTEEYAETGMFRCEHVGTYVMLFDNTYSWIRAKEIFYKATVISPKDHEARLLE